MQNTKKEKKRKFRQRLSYLFLEKENLKDEKVFFSVLKRWLFLFLIFVEILILLQQLGVCILSKRYLSLLIGVSVVVVLTATEAVKIFAENKYKSKTPFYIVDFICAITLTGLTGSAYLCTLYMIVLTEFYLTAKRDRQSFFGCAVCIVVYVAAVWTALALREERIPILASITRSFNDLILLFVHFIIVTVAMKFYRQFLRLRTALQELDESKKELEKAYDDLAEITALEERQRIAKEIHDTAGHSITTVIMQTEAAKLVLAENPEEAKNRIISANLQAKHALEELRESVHLLSGNTAQGTLKENLISIINESTDGTGITVRYEIEDVAVGKEEYRFLCNALKEGISNGLRHGGATAFWFELKRKEEEILFLLSDNGKGVKANAIQKGFGLSGMFHAAKKLGGRAEFSSEENEGFEIALSLPYTVEE